MPTSDARVHDSSRPEKVYTEKEFQQELYKRLTAAREQERIDNLFKRYHEIHRRMQKSLRENTKAISHLRHDDILEMFELFAELGQVLYTRTAEKPTAEAGFYGYGAIHMPSGSYPIHYDEPEEDL